MCMCLRILRTESLPVWFFFYGGSWKDGSKANVIHFGREIFAKQGSLTVIADYVSIHIVKFPTFVEMALKRLLDVPTHCEYKAIQIGSLLQGHSAGRANIGALVHRRQTLTLQQKVKTPSIIKAFAGFNLGPYDFVPYEGDYIRPCLAHLKN